MRSVLFVAGGGLIGCGAGWAGGMAYAVRDLENPAGALYIMAAMLAGTFVGGVVGAALA